LNNQSFAIDGLAVREPERRWLLPLILPFIVTVYLLVMLAMGGFSVINATRSFVNGESRWSKGQKDASFLLHRYAETHSEANYQQFLEALSAPLGYRRARLALDLAEPHSEPDYVEARAGLLAGGSPAIDVDGMMRLLVYFRDLPHVQRALHAWRKGDAEIERLQRVGEQLHTNIAAGATAPAILNPLLLQIEAINHSVTPHELAFSSAMGELSRQTARAVFASIVIVASLLLWIVIWRTRAQLARIAASDEAVRQSEQRYQLALAGSNDGVWDWNILTDSVYFSPRVLEILGTQLSGNLHFSDFTDFLHPEDKERTLQALQAHLRDQSPYDIECRSRTAAGDYLWLRIRGQSVRDASGKPVRMAGSITDITEQRITAQRWQFALEDVGEGIWEWEATTGRVTYSPRWMESMGFDADERFLIGGGARDWFHPDDEPLQWQRLLQHFRGELPLYRSEHRLRRKDGSYKWVADRGKVIEWSPDGRPLRMIGSHIDITHLKQTEEALARSNSQLKAILNAATHVSIIATDRDGLITLFNSGAERLLGYSAAEMLGRSPSVLHLPEEMRARNGTANVPTNASLFDQLQHWRPEDNNWTYVCKDGTRRAVNLIITPVLAGEGEIGGFLGIAIDMSERQQAEQALRDREVVMRALFEQSPLGMTLISRGGRHIESNPAFERLLGYSRAELAAMPFEQFFAPEHRAAQSTMVSEIMARDEFGPIEMILMRKDGQQVSVSANGVALRINNDVLIWSIIEDITLRRAAEREIEQLAFYDALTGLPNRRLFLDRLQHALLRTRRDRQFGALLFLDLDQFKRINDAHDHVTGDHLLQMVGPRLNDVLRAEDTVARLGGDEFVVLLEAIGSTEEEALYHSQALAEKLRAALHLPFYFAGIQHKVSASIGVTLFPRAAESVDDLMRQADTAMYHVKEHGRDGICFFAPAMQARALERLALDRDLQLALSGEQLRLFLQPQIDPTGRVIGAEALLRWQHPQQGLLAPAMFIPVAEESGLIVQIGEWVLHEAGRLLVRLRARSIDFSISVNISPRQFREANFVERVQAVINASGADPRQLVLEITENILVSDIDEAIAKMTALRAFGVRWSLDDFGTGYSSLAYLKRLPLQELKIDRSFVTDVTSDSNDAAIVETILSIARHLGLTAVAEGVETAEQFAFLKAHDCPRFQGYLFGRPTDMLEFFPLLETAEAASLKRR
jgi:diguanylate cyclase (GGDEF)-like protein/PAS domain S-box-containing protein